MATRRAKKASKPTKSAKAAPKKKTPKPHAALYRAAGRELQTILTYVLVTPALRKRVGYPKGSDSTEIELELQFFSSAKMKALNQKHRRKNQHTDVLSFPAHAVFRSRGVLGDLVICPEVMKAQAKEEGHAVGDELRVLLIHGVLHLLDFDHEQGPKAAREMKKWEAAILREIGGEDSAGLIERAHAHEHGDDCSHCDH